MAPYGFLFLWPRESQHSVKDLVDGELQHEMDDLVLECR